jgi:glycosyltransferase involved in cell wall biosynthesis
MRILVLAPHPFFQQRGTPIAVKELLEFLGAEGHQTDVLTYHEGEDVAIPNCRIVRIPRVPGVRGIRPGFSGKKLICDLFMARKLFTMLRETRYDLIHAVEESVFMASAVQRLFGIPFVYDMDSALSEQMVEKHAAFGAVQKWMQRVEEGAVRASVGVLAVCPALVEKARRHAGDKLVACVEDSTLLSGPVSDVERLRADFGPAYPLFLYVGNLEYYQGVDLLLESFAEALGAIPAARLAVIGGNPADIEKYRQRVESLGLRDKVQFLGPRPVGDLGGYLAQADVLVSPRLAGNNTPMKIYSYLDSGVPILATRLPTHTQVLDDSIACLAPPVPSEFGRAMAQLAMDRARRVRLGRQARERAQREFTPEAARRKLRDFYGSVSHLVAAAGRAP